MAEGDVYRVVLQADSLGRLRDYLRDSDLDLGCRPAARLVDGRYVVEAFATQAEVDDLNRLRADSGVTAAILDNVSEHGRARQADVGPGNRMASLAGPPRGLGVKE